MEKKVTKAELADSTVLKKTFTILNVFDIEHTRLSLSEIARRANLPVSTSHRLLKELVEWNAVKKNQDGNFEIGARLWAMGLLAPLNLELRHASVGPMQELLSIGCENAHVGVIDDTLALMVERISSPNAINILSRPGSRLPLHATAIGKILLAYAPSEVQARVLKELPSYTRNTITSPTKMKHEIEKIKKDGYAITVEEIRLGSISIAAPIYNINKEVIAAVGIVFRSTRRDFTKYIPQVLSAARLISQGMTRYN
jgi:DNA-binding IclR family transcriptional regulator